MNVFGSFWNLAKLEFLKNSLGNSYFIVWQMNIHITFYVKSPKIECPNG